MKVYSVLKRFFYTDSREQFLYKTTNEWREPFLKGTPMIRPVIGAPIPMPVNIVEQEEMEIKVYPNPASTLLTVVLPDNRSMANCRIFDAFGRMVESRLGDGNTLNVNHLSPGLYILRMTDSEGRVFTQKFVKE